MAFRYKLVTVSKPLIAFKSKAQADEKAEHIRLYVSILKKPATRLLEVRRGFETTSMHLDYIGKESRSSPVNCYELGQCLKNK